MCGAIVTEIGRHFLHLNQNDAVLLMAGGMSSCLGAVVLAPVTAILIIFEMTHQFALVPGLMLAGLISQVIARSINRANFYDATLLQDGHDLKHLIPPRDLRSWQNLPISALANFKPIVASDLLEQTLAKLMEYPYRHFPVIDDGLLKGIAARTEIAAALAEHREPKLEPAVTCEAGQSIRESQMRLIQSSTGTLIITDDSGNKLLGIVTLHDLLRAQMSVAEREGADET
jgi:CIC family chloride channel protein